MQIKKKKKLHKIRACFHLPWSMVQSINGSNNNIFFNEMMSGLFKDKDNQHLIIQFIIEVC